MPLTAAPRIIGTHGLFFRDGTAHTVPSAGTTSRTVKPGAGDPAWINFGILSAFTVASNADIVDVHACVPGKKVLYDRIENKMGLMFKFTADELSAFSMEVLYRTLALTSASTQFNPLEGFTTKGWLKFQQYDQNNALVNVVDGFVHLKVSGDVEGGGEGLAKVSFEATLLHSTLNTGTL